MSGLGGSCQGYRKPGFSRTWIYGAIGNAHARVYALGCKLPEWRCLDRMRLRALVWNFIGVLTPLTDDGPSEESFL